MKKKRVLAIACFLAVATTVLAYERRTFDAPAPTTEKASETPRSLADSTDPVAGAGPSTPPAGPAGQAFPDHIVYGHLFHQVHALKKKAVELETQGKDGSGLRSHFKEAIGLTHEQDRILARIAAESEVEIARQDEKAQRLIDEYRSRFAGGKVPAGVNSLPPTPPQLAVMQRERDQMILRARNRLRAALGEAEFGRFDETVKRPETLNLHPVPLRHPRSPGGPGTTGPRPPRQ
jgi:hypothetical protein